MDPVFQLHPTGPGLVLAAAAVVLGAPLFSDGLRALRLRREFSRLRDAELGESPFGFLHVSGIVMLESPMFAPLSGLPCAGYRLEVRGIGSPIVKMVDEHRLFSITDGSATARVTDTGAQWQLPVTGEREIVPDQPLTEHLATLLKRAPEALWLRRTGGTLHLVERALPAGAVCHVVGYARHSRPLESEAELEWRRTGTDDAPSVTLAAGAAVARGAAVAASHGPRGASHEPDVWIGSGEHLDFLLVSDRPPQPAQLRIPTHRVLGVAIGPVLSMAGLIYLASAADFLRSIGRF